MVSKDEIRKRHESKIKGIKFQKGKIMERHESKKKLKFQSEEKNKVKYLTKKQRDNVDPVKKWWDAQGTKGKSTLGLMACCLGVILIAGLVGMVFSDKNLVDIQLSNAVYDGSGEYNLNISNDTTEVVIKGSTEAGATVNASSSELNIIDQKVKLNSNNSFKYKVKIPANANEVTVRFDASKPGKDSSYIEIKIKKPHNEPVSTNTPTQPSAPPQPTQNTSNTDPTYNENFDKGYTAGQMWASKDINENQIWRYYPPNGGTYPEVLNDKPKGQKDGYEAGYLDKMKESSYY